MGRIPNFRSNFDDLRKLSLVDLKRMDLLIGWASTNITWTRQGDLVGSIGVIVKVGLDYWQPTTGYVELSYSVNGEAIEYRVDLVQVYSNLGKGGGIWYFICPITKKRCRTLFASDKYFVSRHALQRTMYESQTYSKQYRLIAQMYGTIYKLRAANEALSKPYTKVSYRGKPTPKAQKVFKWQQANSINYSQELMNVEDQILSLMQ